MFDSSVWNVEIATKVSLQTAGWSTSSCCITGGMALWLEGRNGININTSRLRLTFCTPVVLVFVTLIDDLCQATLGGQLVRVFHHKPIRAHAEHVAM